MDQICPKKGISGRKRKHHLLTINILISLGTKFHFKQSILNFGIKFAQKVYFRLKTKKVSINIEFSIFELVKVPDFSLNWESLFFGSNCSKKVFPVENRKGGWGNFVYCYYSLFQISALTENFVFMDKKCPKRVFPLENRKSGHHYGTLHIRINLSTQFQFKETILIFQTKYAPRQYF